MAAGVGVERRDADQAMHADLRLQQAVGILAVDLEGGGFDAGAFTLQPVGDDGLEAVALGPPQVHAEQHFGPVLAFGAARTGVNGDDGAAHVVFAGEQHGGLEALEELAIGFQIAGDVGSDILALAGELEKGIQIVGHGADALVARNRLFQALAFLHDLLALFGLIPEIGRGDLLLGLG